MILLPALIGGALAAMTALTLARADLLRRPFIIALILIAIAAFWPLFAVAAQDDTHVLFHVAVFAVFGAIAFFSHRIGLAGLALALIAHGVFDGVLFTTAHVGPLWWPVFCASFDVVLGVALFVHLRKSV